MKIFQIVQSVNNMSSGPTYSVGELAEKLSRAGHFVKVNTFGVEPEKWPFDVALENIYGLFEKYKLLGVKSIIKFREASLAYDVMHCHGVWRASNLFTLFLPKVTKAKIIWSPRGMFSDWSWRHHSFLKKPFWILLQKPAVIKADCFHATAQSEYEDIRKRELMQPVAIIPNGVNIPYLGSIEKQKVIVFLSRIHKKKGIELLLDAWKSMEDKYPDWNVKIAGPLDSSYANEIQEYSKSKNICRVEFLGQVLGEEKKQLLSTAGVFVLPSYSENFGIAIAEALAHGTCVITTTATPWEGVEGTSSGWWVEPELTSIKTAMESALSTPMSELVNKGERGREWMKQDFSWEAVSNKMERLYEWISGDKDRPDFVKID